MPPSGAKTSLLTGIVLLLSFSAAATFANSHGSSGNPYVQIETGHKWVRNDFTYYQDFNAEGGCEERVLSDGAVTQGWVGTGCDDQYRTVSVGPSADCRDQGYHKCRVQIHAYNQNCDHGSCDKNWNSDSQYFSIDWSDPSSSYVSPTPADGTVQNSDFSVDVNDYDAYSGLQTCYYQINDLGRSGVEVSGTRSCDSGFTVNVGPSGDCQSREPMDCRIRVRARDQVGNYDGWTVRTYSTNYQPNVNSFSLSDHGSDHAIQVSAVVSDQDGDGDFVDCQANVNDGDGNQRTISLSINEGYGNGNEAQCTGTVRYSADAGWAHLETMNVQIHVDDGARADNSGTKSHTFPNHGLSIVSANSFTDSSTTHSFQVSAAARDTDDGEGEISGCTVIHNDGDGNSYTRSGNLNRGYGGGDESECTYTIDAETIGGFTGYTVNEQVNVRVRFTDQHGSTVTTSQTSHTIPNHRPAIINDVSVSNSSTKHVYTATAVAEDTDDPNEIVSCTGRFTAGGTTVTKTGTLNQAYGTNRQEECTVSINISSPFSIDDRINTSILFSDRYGATRRTSYMTNNIPNREPVIQAEYIWPSGPDFNDTVTIGLNITDVEDQTAWANLTVFESGNRIVDNVNGSKTVNGTYQLWNMTSFTLDEPRGIYDWSITVSDTYDTVTTSGKFVVVEVAPNATSPVLRRVEPYSSRETHYRPGQTLKVSYSVEDWNGREEIATMYANITSPSGTVASFIPFDTRSTLVDGYQGSFTYTLPSNAEPGQWSVRAYVRDTKGLDEVNTTTFQVHSFNTVTKGISYEDEQGEEYIDGEPASSGTYSSLDFPYFISTSDLFMTGLVNYGSFRQLSYQDGARNNVNMTHNGVDDLTLLPATDSNRFYIEQLQEHFTGGLVGQRTFLSKTVASFGYGISAKNQIEVSTSFEDEEQILLRGFNESLQQGFFTLVIENMGVENGKVVVEVRREGVGG